MTKYTPEFLARFWAKVDCTAGLFECWLWTASKNFGYGHIWLNGRFYQAHRVSYELAYEAIPDGMLVCHHCDDPSCVNPSHLFLGTTLDNVHDKIQKGRAKGYRKLTKTQVEEIRRRYAEGGIFYRELALIFHCSVHQILNIVKRYDWK